MATDTTNPRENIVSHSGQVALSTVVWRIPQQRAAESLEQINRRLNRNAAAFLAKAEQNTQRLTGKSRF